MILLRKTKKLILILSLVASLFATICFSVIVAKASSPILIISAFDKKYYFYDYETSVHNGKRYLNDLSNVVDKIFLDTLKIPIDSTVVFNPSNFENPFTITKSSNGECIDKEKLKKDVDLALNLGNDFISCSTLTLLPKITEKDAKSTICLRGEFSTSYSASTKSRKTNILLATKSLNGKVVESGKTFSFNKSVGERSEKNGYEKAKIIINGEFVDGVGGGVCQVSTTLYNALLLSNLKVSEKHAHSLTVNYVEPSFDAMVSGSSIDLKFINDTNNLIYITAKADGNTLKFKIYGENNPYKIVRVSKITKTILPKACEYVESNDLFIGEQNVLQYEKNGIESQGFLQYYINGKMVKEQQLRKDSYKPVNAKVLVGTKQLVTQDEVA